MKIGHFLINLFAAITHIVFDIFPAGLAILSSLVGAVVWDFPDANQGMIADSVGIMFLTLGVMLLAVISMIFSIIALAKYRTVGSKYLGFSIAVCALSLIQEIFAIIIAIWANNFAKGGEFFFAWPVLGGLFLAAMIVFTVINAKKDKDNADFRAVMNHTNYREL